MLRELPRLQVTLAAGAPLHLPRRKDLPNDHGLLITAAAVHRQRDLFFVLVQSECGDLYKATLAVHNDVVTELRVCYLDTVPPCISLCILKSGFLFCASEFSDHGFYQLQQGVSEDDDQSPACSSKQFEAKDLTVSVIEPRPLKTSCMWTTWSRCAQSSMPSW